MPAAPKPTPGAPIETTWGGQVHDVAVLARGVIAAGPATSTKGAHLPIATIYAGDASMVDMTTNDFVAPVDGIYEWLATIGCTGAARGADYISHVYRSNPKTYAYISGTSPTAGGTARRIAQAGLIPMVAGERVYVEATEPVSGGSMNIDSVCFRLIAQALG